METEINRIKEKLKDYSNLSKVWIYFSATSFDLNTDSIQKEIDNYTASWSSHGHKVVSNGYTIANQIILIVADITQSEVSGCATDNSVQFIKSIQEKYELDFFQRDNICTLIVNKIEMNSISKIKDLDPETAIFNPFFNNLGEWKSSLIVPLKESKYKRML